MSRSRNINIRVTESDYQAVSEAAESMGITISELTRKLYESLHNRVIFQPRAQPYTPAVEEQVTNEGPIAYLRGHRLSPHATSFADDPRKTHRDIENNTPGSEVWVFSPPKRVPLAYPWVDSEEDGPERFGG